MGRSLSDNYADFLLQRSEAEAAHEQARVLPCEKPILIGLSLDGNVLDMSRTCPRTRPMSPHFQGHGVVPGQCGLRLVESCVWRTCPHI
jgi:hypothetical protein